MPTPLIGAILPAVIGGATSLFGASKQASAAEDATQAQIEASKYGVDAQLQSSEAGLEEQRRQFDMVRGLLEPYVEAGYEGLSGQRTLLGLTSPEAEQAAIDRITGGSQFKEMERQGLAGILAGASATGGLRGGNTQRALAQFRPNILNRLLEQQYSRLGGLTTTGQNSAVGTGAAGQQSANNIAQLLNAQGIALAQGANTQGNAIAQGALAQGNAWASGISGLGDAFQSGLGAYQNIQSGSYIPVPTPSPANPGGF